MSPRELVRQWVDAFDRADVEELASLYEEHAVNPQVAPSPVHGRENIRAMFSSEFSRAKMVCIVENVFEDGEWAMLEWRDPVGRRGCGFFHVQNGRMLMQRGYWDQLTFARLHPQA